MLLLRALLASLAASLVQAGAWADAFIQLEAESVRVCAVAEADAPPPSPAAPGCVPAAVQDVDPHGRMLWVLGSITPAQSLLETEKPIGFFLSAKAASRVFLNGEELFSNGRPGLDRNLEQPGRIDAVFHVRRDQLRREANEIAVLLSGHHSRIPAGRAVLVLGLFEYLEPPHHERGRAWLTFSTLGVFLVAGLYASVLAGFRLATIAPATLAVMAFLAAGQVLAETLRSVWNYPYPVHDLRRVAIVGCGLGVGMTLAAHVVQRLGVGRKTILLAAIFFAALAAVLATDDFDLSASRALLVPTALAALIALWRARSGARIALVYGVGLSAFAALNLLDPGEFLDLNYFIALSILVLFLTALQAFAYREAVLEQEATARTRRQLEDALARAAHGASGHLLVRHSGRMEKLAYDRISSLNAAGDYVLIRLVDGREILSTTSLTALEKDLPASFLRVHRSHTVNADAIASLTRTTGRSGALTLSTGEVVPVSRRILPRVRQALIGTGASDQDAP